MKRLINYFFIVATLVSAILIGGCSSDDIDGDLPVIPGYGADREISLPADFSEDFPLGVLTCVFDTGSEIKNICAMHSLVDGLSVLTLSEPLPLGHNQLKAVKFVDSVSDNMLFELGCTIDVEELLNDLIPENYNLEYKLFGEGTKENPFLISSAVNFQAINNIPNTKGLYFEQSQDVDFSLYFGHELGFEGVCPDVNSPFRGIFDGRGFTVSNLAIRRYTDGDIDEAVASKVIKPAGLFSSVAGATIKNVILDNPDIWGHEAVGGVVGMINGSTTDETSASVVEGCSILRSINNDNMIYGTCSVGGVVGSVELGAKAIVKRCIVDKLVRLKIRSFANKGSYLGGVIGGSGLSSQLYVESCENYANLTADGISCSGGIVGTAEFATIVNCLNKGDISVSGDSSFGVGGLIGGSVDAAIIASTNRGVISGYRGVGGIVGSTAYDTGAENPMFGNAILASCHNYGEITGSRSVGGQVGEAQANLTNCYNAGSVSKIGDYEECEIGGFVGYGSVATIRGSHNVAPVNGSNAGGLIGAGEFFYVYTSTNFGAVNGTLSTGGVIGKTSEYGAINYVNNYGRITGTGEVGGLIGELGEASSMSDKFVAFGLDVARDVVAMAVKAGGEKASEVIASLLKVHEVIEIGKEGLEFIHVCVEGSSEEEAVAEADLLEKDIEKWTAAMDGDMLSVVNGYVADDNSSYHYRGDLPVCTNIARLTLENITSLNGALNGDTANYMDSLYAEIEHICEKNASYEFWKEMEQIIASCALGVASLALGGVKGIIVYGVGSVMMDAAGDLTEDELNTIIVTQAINYGYSDGNGLVGAIGDRIRFRNCISAGSSAGYAISNGADGKNLYSEMLLSIGDKDKAPYDDGNHGVYCYGDLNASDFSNPKKFSDYDSTIWNIDQSGGILPLPYNSEYLNFK